MRPAQAFTRCNGALTQQARVAYRVNREAESRLGDELVLARAGAGGSLRLTLIDVERSRRQRNRKDSSS